MAGNLNLRRMRQSPWVRELAREVHLSHTQFIQPLFSVEGIASREEIPGLNGTYRDTPDTLLAQIESDMEAGVRKFLLFGVPKGKATSKFDFSFTANQVSAIKKRFGDELFLAVDVCLCSMTKSGQCGILNPEGDHVENDATVDELARAAVAYASAGADCVAPSDMMDGRIYAIREALAEARLDRTLIMSYAAKFHSRFYGPFRVAADSAPKMQLRSSTSKAALTDRATYQIDPARPTDALESAHRDAEEGADILMVKPGLPYLDVLSELSTSIPKPWAVYEVSGEYAAIELMGEKGLINAEAAHVESWIALDRAGASMIISYGSRYAKTWIERQSS